MKNSVVSDIFNGLTGNRETMRISKENLNNLGKVANSYDKQKNVLPKSK